MTTVRNITIRRGMLVLLTLLMSAIAQAEITEWRVSEGQTFASGQTIDENKISLTFGEAGGPEFQEAQHDPFDGYDFYAPGNNVNGDKEGGTFYTFRPHRDGWLSIRVRLNHGKQLYIEENGTPLPDYDGRVTGEDEPYEQEYVLWVTGGRVYKVYASGSKLGFYGFRFDWQEGMYEDYGESVQLKKYLFTYCWSENERFYVDNDDRIVYDGDEWGGLVCVFDQRQDWSSYSKVVFELAEPAPMDVQIYMDFGEAGDEVTSGAPKGSTRVEFERGNMDWSHVHALVLQPAAKGRLLIRSVHLEKGGFVVDKFKYHLLSGTGNVEVIGIENASGEVTIPERVTYGGITYTVTTIGALRFVTNVTTLNVPNTVKKIGYQAFVYSSFVTINLPASVEEIGDQAFIACDRLHDIHVDAANKNFKSIDGVLFTKDMERIVRYPATKTGGYRIPDGVKILGTSAFDACRKLTTVVLPESVSVCWWYPFWGCNSLSSVVSLRKNELFYSDSFMDDAGFSRATLYVPKGSTAAYKSNQMWGRFREVKEIPSEITITAKSFEITYGGSLPAYTFTATDNLFVGEPKITCSATKTSGAGTYDIIIDKASISSPTTLKIVNGKLTIKKAPLTISVGNYTKRQGDPMPEFKLSYGGFVNRERVSVLKKQPTISCSATVSSAPGEYPITLTGAQADNYDITYRNGTLTVTAAQAIVISAKSYTIGYGDPIPTLEYTVSGGALEGGTPTLSCAAGAVGSRPDAGVYDIVVNKGGVTNYNVSLVKGTLTVNKAPLTISVGNYTKRQGDPMPEFKLSYSGFVNRESVSVLKKQPTISCSATVSSAPGEYPITLTGAQADNYDITYRNGTLTVTAAQAIVISAKSYTIGYGDPIPTLEYTVSGGALEGGTPTLSCAAGAVGSRPDAGVYDIVVNKGGVTNYNVSLVKGTLTVNKASLRVSVGNYTKYEGEDMPEMTISYSGFKNGDDRNALRQQPTISCEATKWSPAGNYPITVSGGESPNYDITYRNGTLTVKHVFSMALSTLGHGSIGYQGNEVTNFQRFEVREGSVVSLTINPDNGYKLDKLTQNGLDVTSRLSNNRYELNNLAEDINIVATFTETNDNFSSGMVSYSTLSAPNATVRVARVNYSADQGLPGGGVEIPSMVEHDGQTWTVEGIANNAFSSCGDMVFVKLPATLKAGFMGASLFTGCSSLAAIEWEAAFVMTDAMLGTVNNPNLLFYTKDKAYAPASVANVVVDGRAGEIRLSETGNFFCPKAFTASAISYTHNYSMQSAIGGIGGWETIALPFDVQKVSHDAAGQIVPFTHWSGSDDAHRPFWLFGYESSGFARAYGIKANTPYLICMPNNDEYESDYRLAGNVTFSAEDAEVKPTTELYLGVRGSRRFVPSFSHQTKQSQVYALNVSNEQHSETNGETAGSVFVSGLRDVSPFEAYMTSSEANARGIIGIEIDGATSLGGILAGAQGGLQHVYNMQGQLLIQTDSEAELRRLLRQLPSGVYIVNGKKRELKN